MSRPLLAPTSVSIRLERCLVESHRWFALMNEFGFADGKRLGL
jgi:hypothetical protein